jgi:hypothetical protein
VCCESCEYHFTNVLIAALNLCVRVSQLVYVVEFLYTDFVAKLNQLGEKLTAQVTIYVEIVH